MIPNILNRGAILCLSLALGLWGCGSEETPAPDTSQPGVPKLQFAGVDLIYALRRVTTEAGLILTLDEIKADEMAPDLGRFRVDLDLPAGPVTDALDTLKKESGSFDYLINDNVVYVRSNLTVGDQTGLDTPDLKQAKFTGNIEDLIRWIMTRRPRTFLKSRRIRGEPIFRKVELDIAEGSSVRDVLMMYAKAANRGWRMRRSGRLVGDQEGRQVYLASTIRLWGPLQKGEILSKFREEINTTTGLARIEARTGTPICVIDRSMLGNHEGWLNSTRKGDPEKPLEEALDWLAWAGDRSRETDNFRWEKQDGLVRVVSRHFSYYLPGRDLLRAKVGGGSFEGSLPELARWLNENRLEPAEKFLMAGEITGAEPRARLEISEGSSVEQVLLDFARVSGAGWNLIIQDVFIPDAPEDERPRHAWHGAYIAPLSIWM